MAEIDEVKELLTTLRVLFSLGIGLIVAIASAISNLMDKGDYNFKFYALIFFLNILTVFLTLLLRLIFKKIKALRSM